MTATQARVHARRRILPWGTVFGLLALLELLPRVGMVSAQYVPTVTSVAAVLAQLVGTAAFWSHVGATLHGWSVGLGLAVVTGIPAGLAIGGSRNLYRLFRVLIDFLRPIPPIAILPLAVLLFGTGVQMRIYLVAFSAFFPVLFQAIYGAQEVDPIARDTARAYGLTRLEQFAHVVVPSAAPYIATGLRLSASIALVVSVATEIIVGSSGLGFAINAVRYASDFPGMYAYIVVTGVLGYLVAEAFRRSEARILHWHASQGQKGLG